MDLRKAVKCSTNIFNSFALTFQYNVEILLAADTAFLRPHNITSVRSILLIQASKGRLGGQGES